MEDQYNLIHNTSWDTLVVLDAMRYDIFKKYNRFKGRLIKARSRAAHTYPWLWETFSDKYSWLYFSAHMYVGDKIHSKRDWNGVQHFKKVIPIWEDHYDENLGTVHPYHVGKTVKKYFEENPPEKCIVHYIQPHGPWIGTPSYYVPWTKEMHEQYYVMADFLAQAERPDPKFFRKAYIGNVKLVLRSLKQFIKYFPGQVVITADHGEMLGEYSEEKGRNLYLHKINFPLWADDLVKTVPWLVVKQ